MSREVEGTGAAGTGVDLGHSSREEGAGEGELSLAQVAEVATLARLGLERGELEQLQKELSVILSHISAIAAVNTESVAEMARVGETANSWREDVTTPSLPVELVLANAPARQGDHFLVGAIQE